MNKIMYRPKLSKAESDEDGLFFIRL